MEDHSSEGNYKTCRVKPTPVVEAVAAPTGCLGDWVTTNAFGSGEKSIGPIVGHSNCVEKARQECPEFDLVNTDKNPDETGCWCQKSHAKNITEYADPTSSYLTCRVVALPGWANTTNNTIMNTTNNTSDAIWGGAPTGPDGCYGDWVTTNQFTTSEVMIGSSDSAAGCVNEAKAKCEANFDLVNTNADPYFNGNDRTSWICYCQKTDGQSWESARHTGGLWKSCRMRNTDASPVAEAAS